MSKNNTDERNKLLEAIVELLPGPDIQGDPFWTVMEIGPNNVATGVYQTVNNDIIVPLFLTQLLAEKYHSQTCDNDNTAVRGISRPHLAAMIQMWKLGLIKLGIASPKSSDSGLELFLPESPEKFEDYIRERYSQ